MKMRMAAAAALSIVLAASALPALAQSDNSTMNATSADNTTHVHKTHKKKTTHHHNNTTTTNETTKTSTTTPDSMAPAQ